MSGQRGKVKVRDTAGATWFKKHDLSHWLKLYAALSSLPSNSLISCAFISFVILVMNFLVYLWLICFLCFLFLVIIITVLICFHLSLISPLCINAVLGLLCQYLPSLFCCPLLFLDFSFPFGTCLFYISDNCLASWLTLQFFITSSEIFVHCLSKVPFSVLMECHLQ